MPGLAGRAFRDKSQVFLDTNPDFYISFHIQFASSKAHLTQWGGTQPANGVPLLGRAVRGQWGERGPDFQTIGVWMVLLPQAFRVSLTVRLPRALAGVGAAVDAVSAIGRRGGAGRAGGRAVATDAIGSVHRRAQAEGGECGGAEERTLPRSIGEGSGVVFCRFRL